MLEQSPSAGKTAAIGISTGSAGIVLLLYVAKHVGLEDMTPEVAAAIITFAGTLVGGIMHINQRRTENAQVNPAAGVTGGPGA